MRMRWARASRRRVRRLRERAAVWRDGECRTLAKTWRAGAGASTMAPVKDRSQSPTINGDHGGPKSPSSKDDRPAPPAAGSSPGGSQSGSPKASANGDGEAESMDLDAHPSSDSTEPDD